MSAEILRRAAAEIREDYSAESMGMPTDDPFMFAVADWLEDAADAYDDDVVAHEAESERGKYPMWSPRVSEPALAVARAYLGDAS